MPATYLLPCHGEKKVEVTPASAGRTIVCPCGKNVVVPTLRELRQLPRVDGDEARPRATAPAWSMQQGVIFSLGLFLMAVCLTALATLTFHRMRIDTSAPEMNQQMLKRVDRALANAEPAATLDAWRMLRDNPLPEKRPKLIFEANREEARQLEIYMVVAGVVGLIGIGLVIAGPLARPKPRRRPPEPKPAKSRA